MDGKQYVDGGIRDITPLGAVLDEKPDACLVVLASPLQMNVTRKKFPNLFKIGLRSLDIMVNEIYRNDLAEAEWINQFLMQWQRLEEGLKLSASPSADPGQKLPGQHADNAGPADPRLQQDLPWRPFHHLPNDGRPLLFPPPSYPPPRSEHRPHPGDPNVR